MAGKHRRPIDPRTDKGMTVEELKRKLTDLQDEDTEDDYPAKHGNLDDDD